MSEQRRFTPGSIPVTMRSGNVALRSESLVEHKDEAGNVVAPDPAEVAFFNATRKTCGQCQWFDRTEKAQNEIQSQQFYKRLVREEKWQLHHLGSSPADLGLCGMSNGEMLTGVLHRACDQFKENRGLILITNKPKGR